jgi:hypothetical protein
VDASGDLPDDIRDGSALLIGRALRSCHDVDGRSAGDYGRIG